MTDMKRLLADVEAVRLALKIGAISYDGDSWYAASGDGGAGLGYDECDAALSESSAAIGRIANRVPDYEAAVDALERLCDDRLGDDDAEQAWDDARAALARLRGAA